MRKFNCDLNFEQLKIRCCGIGNYNENGIFDVYIFGDSNISKSFLYYFTYNSLVKQDQKNHLYFETWNTTPAKRLNYILPLQKSNNILLFDSELYSLNNKTLNKELIDEEQYIRPTINKNENKLYGMLSFAGLKIFDLSKKEEEKILYPGRKNLLCDYIFSEEKIIMCSSDQKIILYDIRENNCDISRKHKWNFNYLTWGDRNYKSFYAYSEEKETIFLFDCRNLSHYSEIIKEEILVEKFKFNENNNNLYIQEVNSEALLSIDKNGVEKIYETNNDIITFDFNIDFQLLYILKLNNSLNILDISTKK